MNSSIFDESIAGGGEFLLEIGTVLVFDISDDRLPAIHFNFCAKISDLPAIIVNLVSVTGGINNCETKLNAVLVED